MSVATAHGGEVGGGGRVHGPPCTRAFDGCDVEVCESHLSCMVLIIADKLALRQGGDLTTQSPAWSSSPSSSSLIKWGSSRCKASLSDSVATFMRFTNSCKDRWYIQCQWVNITKDVKSSDFKKIPHHVFEQYRNGQLKQILTNDNLKHVLNT